MKRRRKPDKRLDWRDPDMPVIRTGTVDGVFGVHEINQRWINLYSQRRLEEALEPEYKNDPSYYWSRKKK